MKVDVLSPFGQALRRWRSMRGVSQLALAVEAGVSTRHLSFIETGRSRPGRELILRLAEALDVPPRERNELLTAAGFSALYQERELSEGELEPYLRIVQRILDNHDPFPAFALDRWWNVVLANEATARLVPALTQAGGNAIEVYLANQPPRLLNREEIGRVLLGRIREDWMRLGHDEKLLEYMKRLEDDLGKSAFEEGQADWDSPVIAARIDLGDTVASTVGTIIRFETAREITLNELRIELHFPADSKTEELFRLIAQT